ncbi:MAG: hypothetical protein MHMPM18_000265 [Marteilia pararefringens]
MQCLASSSAAAGSISCNNNKTSSPRQAPRLLFALANMVLLLYVFHSAPPEHFDWFTAWMAMIVAHLIRFDALVCKKNGCCTEGGDLLSIIVGVATICIFSQIHYGVKMRAVGRPKQKCDSPLLSHSNFLSYLTCAKEHCRLERFLNLF